MLHALNESQCLDYYSFQWIAQPPNFNGCCSAYNADSCTFQVLADWILNSNMNSVIILLVVLYSCWVFTTENPLRSHYIRKTSTVNKVQARLASHLNFIYARRNSLKRKANPETLGPALLLQYALERQRKVLHHRIPPCLPRTLQDGRKNV